MSEIYEMRRNIKIRTVEVEEDICMNLENITLALSAILNVKADMRKQPNDSHDGRGEDIVDKHLL